MAKKHVIISYTHLTVDELIAFVWFILSKMTNNPDFTTPDPGLADVKTILEDLETKNTAAMDGGKTARARLVKAHELMLETLRSLGLYVEKIAKGNEAIILGSGFQVSKDRIPGSRKDFWAKYATHSGELLVGCKAYPKAVSYVWQAFTGEAPPTDENQWKWKDVTAQAGVVLKNLPTASVVWLRYCPVTRVGMQSWCSPISILVT